MHNNEIFLSKIFFRDTVHDILHELMTNIRHLLINLINRYLPYLYPSKV